MGECEKLQAEGGGTFEIQMRGKSEVAGSCRQKTKKQTSATQILFCNLELRHRQGCKPHGPSRPHDWLICYMTHFFLPLCQKSTVSNQVWRVGAVTDASITRHRRRWRPLWSIMSHSPLTARLRRSGVTAAQMGKPRPGWRRVRDRARARARLPALCFGTELHRTAKL